MHAPILYWGYRGRGLAYLFSCPHQLCCCIHRLLPIGNAPFKAAGGAHVYFCVLIRPFAYRYWAFVTSFNSVASNALDVPVRAHVVLPICATRLTWYSSAAGKALLSTFSLGLQP